MLLHCWECKMVQTLWKKSMTIPPKFSSRTAIWSSSSTSGYIYRRIESRIVKRCLHSNVRISTINNSQELVLAKQLASTINNSQMSINGWINNQMQSIHTGEHCFSLKKGKKYFHMLQYRLSWGHYAKQKKKKNSHKMTNTVWLHWNKVSRVGKFIETNSRIVVARG